MPTIHLAIVPRLARVAAVAALAAGAASGVGAQQPPTRTTPQRDSARAATDSARAAAQDTTRRGARRQSAGGEVERSPAGERVRKDANAPATPATPATTPAATPTQAAPSTTTPNPTTPNPTTPSPTAPEPARRDSTAPVGAEAATSALVASLLTDAHAVALLHESNLAEIQAGTLAQREARDSAVRAFATMVVTDHGTLDQRATTLAQQAGVTPALPDSQLPRLHAGEMGALPAPGAAGFDSAYVARQVAAHARTLALVDAAIERAQNAELRAMLQAEVRPRVASHLDAARALQQRLGGR